MAAEPTVRLTERDLGLLGDLARFGVLSFTQIGTRHFPKASMPTVCNRLSQLVYAGFVHRFRIGREIYHGRPKLIGVVYRVTRAGLSVLQAYSPEGPVPARPMPLNPANLSHDLLLVDVVSVLERRFPGTRISPGHLLERRDIRSGRRPDAVIEFPDGGGRMAVELELTVKSARRYREIVTTYRLLPEYQEVLSVVSNRSIEAAIQSQILGYKPRPGLAVASTGKFRFVTLTTLLKG